MIILLMALSELTEHYFLSRKGRVLLVIEEKYLVHFYHFKTNGARRQAHFLFGLHVGHI